MTQWAEHVPLKLAGWNKFPVWSYRRLEQRVIAACPASYSVLMGGWKEKGSSAVLPLTPYQCSIRYASSRVDPAEVGAADHSWHFQVSTMRSRSWQNISDTFSTNKLLNRNRFSWTAQGSCKCVWLSSSFALRHALSLYLNSFRSLCIYPKMDYCGAYHCPSSKSRHAW